MSEALDIGPERPPDAPIVVGPGGRPLREACASTPRPGPPPRPVYGLFVDENGNPSLRRLEHPDNRYLSLTGVACALAYERETIGPGMDSLKQRHFGRSDIVFHCYEMKRYEGPFAVLADPVKRTLFDADILTAFDRWDYTVFSVLLDKQALVERYGCTRHDPYHYALESLLEGYVRWLEERGAAGEVMAEGRGKKEDRQLEQAFTALRAKGTEYLDADRLQARLTSSQLKIRGKAHNVAGLQLADLLAHPSFTSMKARHQGEAMPDTFGRRVVEILEATRYYRVDDCIDGCGRKWLPPSL